MSRKAYMDGTITHHNHYMAVARAIGLPILRKLVQTHIADRAHIAECLKVDEHLNNIPLTKWDRLDQGIRDLIATGRAAAVMAESWDHPENVPAKTYYWSLSETVCTLKAVARDLALDICTNCGQWRNDGRCLNDCQQKGLDTNG